MLVISAYWVPWNLKIVTTYIAWIDLGLIQLSVPRATSQISPEVL